ncbi:MAG: hypothetical protein KDK08_27890 [Rhizobiaceae bacterium]|nr:hypothetical protein [Rhizobiaceae bacterium]
MSIARQSSSLPGILGEIADAVGVDAALQVAREYGGVRKDIPAEARMDHWLTDCLGYELADKVCRHLAIQDADGRRKGVIYHEVIPLGPASMMKRARRQLAEAILSGKSVRAASREAGLHERTGWRINSRLKERDDDQGDLF